LGFTDFIVAIEKIVKGLNELLLVVSFLHQGFAIVGVQLLNLNTTSNPGAAVVSF
jgi:hypothetical protein